MLGRPFRIGIFSRCREEVEGGKGTEGERRDTGRIVAVNQGKREGGSGSREVAAWKAIVGEKARREEAAKAEAERIATEKAEAERKGKERRKESC